MNPRSQTLQCCAERNDAIAAMGRGKFGDGWFFIIAYCDLFFFAAFLSYRSYSDDHFNNIAGDPGIFI